MTDSQDTDRTRVIARTIEADPVRPPSVYDAKPLVSSSAGASFMWAAATLVSISVTALVYSQVNGDWFKNATTVARFVAPPWPADGDPTLWASWLATTATVLAFIVVVAAAVKIPVPPILVLVGGLLLALLLLSPVWSTINVLNKHEWTTLPASLLCVMVFGLALRAAAAWRRKPSSATDRGPLARLIGALVVAAAVLLFGTQIVVATEQSHNVPVAFATKSASVAPPVRPRQPKPSKAALRQLAADRRTDAPKTAKLAGRWVAQVAAANHVSEARAVTYLKALKSWRFKVLLVDGRDLGLRGSSVTYWVTITATSFRSKASVTAWCKKTKQNSHTCIARQLPKRKK